jgi:transcriptional regulator
MHPNPSFQARIENPLAHAGRLAFAHLFASPGGRLMVAHVPMLVRNRRLWFHLANGNALAPHLNGDRALASFAGPGSYVSPNCYAAPARNVPTWNDEATEVEGAVTALLQPEREMLLDQASANFEPGVGEDWTMARLARPRAEAMMRAITGFVLTPDAICYTNKASRNRSPADADAVADALDARGDHAGAAQIRAARTAHPAPPAPTRA